MVFNQFFTRPAEQTGWTRKTGRRSAVQSAVLLLCFASSAMAATDAPPAVPEAQPAVESGGLKEVVWKAFLYLPNRAADLVDTVRFNVGVGLGLGANIRPTKGLQFGAACYDTVRFGLRGRRSPFWHEWSLEGGIDGMYEELGDTERGFHEVGGTIHVLLVGLDAAVDVEELLDFGFGLFMADPADDDYR